VEKRNASTSMFQTSMPMHNSTLDFDIQRRGHKHRKRKAKRLTGSRLSGGLTAGNRLLIARTGGLGMI